MVSAIRRMIRNLHLKSFFDNHKSQRLYTNTMKRLALALLNIMLFLALVSSVSAYTFIDSNRDGFYIQIENGSIARYDHDVTRQWTRNGFNETALLTVMPDGGVYANSVHSGTPESVRYNPDGSVNINSVTTSLSTSNPSYGTYYNRKSVV